YPKLLFIAAGTVFLLGLTPINFLLTTFLALFLAGSGYMLLQRAKVPEEQEEELDEVDSDTMRSQENVVNLLSIDPIEFEFGYALIPLVDASQGGDLLDRIIMIRRQLAIELGVVVPVVRIRDNIQLEPNEYRLKIKGDEVAQGELLLDHYLAMTPDLDDDTIDGIQTKEPAFGLPAKWISEDLKDEAEMFGYTVVDPPSVVSTHLTEVLKRNVHQLLGRQETKDLIDHLKEDYPILVDEVTPDPLGIGDVQKVLAKLLKENVSIRNLPVIFETLADYGKMTSDTDLLVEYVRQALSVQITKQYVTGEQMLNVITISQQVEQVMMNHIQQTEHGNYLALDPASQEKIVQNIYTQMEGASLQYENIVILSSPTIRMYVKQLIERTIPDAVVLSYNELEPTVQIQSVGVVEI